MPAHVSSSVMHYSSEYSAFLHQVHEFFTRSTPLAPLSQWMAQWLAEKMGVLAFEENYAFVMDHFCESVDPAMFPNRAQPNATILPRWAWQASWYRDGCPSSDPSFAESGHVMLATGLGCLAPTRCLPPRWLALVEEHFLNRSKLLTKNDLFFSAAVCNIPYVERNGSRVLSFFKGLYPRRRLPSPLHIARLRAAGRV